MVFISHLKIFKKLMFRYQKCSKYQNILLLIYFGMDDFAEFNYIFAFIGRSTKSVVVLTQRERLLLELIGMRVRGI
jgi:hypothetical protein